MAPAAILDLLSTLRPAATAAPAAATDAGRFAAQGRLPDTAVSVTIDRFGALDKPVASDQAAALQRGARPARYGHRSQTKYDPAVRDTAEIPAEALGVCWADGAYAALQAELAQALGAERLEARVHNLLVYGPGQFFKPHQDTEKHPRMVATLVLVWPSAHIGGELRVYHGGDEARLASQQLHGGREIRWFAFYADCRHEVLPVDEGWRIALTFDLLLPEAASASAPPDAALQAALRQHFGLAGEPRLQPWVLLLDHEYTEHGLRWGLLKGEDRWRVAALRAACESLGLRVHLALAELHESWTAQPSGRASRRGAEPGVEPDELIDQSLTLDFWVDAQGRVGPPNGLGVALDDTASYTETGKAHLVDSEYEGYMGNYGETLDYWYRRAALVMQSPLAAERTRFAVDFDAALADLVALAGQPGAEADLAARVHAGAERLVSEAAGRGRLLLAAYAEIAAVLPDAEAACALMRRFEPPTFLPEDGAVLARLERARGTPWMQTLLQAWTGPDAPGRRWSAGWPVVGRETSAPRLWPAALPAFTQACLDAGLSRVLMDDWSAAHLRALTAFDAGLARATPAERALLQQARLDAVCQLATAMRCVPAGAARLDALLDHVAAQPRLYPPPALAPLVLAAGGASAATPRGQALYLQVVDALSAELSGALREAGDHGLRHVEWQCRCPDCTVVVRWAEAAGGAPLTCPMAEPRRQHVQSRLQAAGAPIVAETLKQGSPHKLRLSKPGDLQAQELALREQHRQALASLQDGAVRKETPRGLTPSGRSGGARKARTQP